MEPDATKTMVPLSVVDGLMAMIARHMHDSPVQALVAAKLMVESTKAADDASTAMKERGVLALTRAAQQSRDVMWALGRDPEPAASPAELAEVLRDNVGRAGGASSPQVEVQATQALMDAAGQAHVSDLVKAVLDVCAASHLTGGQVSNVSVTSQKVDGHAVLTATVTGAGDIDSSKAKPWLDLARCRARLAISVDKDVELVQFNVSLSMA